MYGCMDVWMYVWMDGWMYVWMDVCMYGWMDVCMDGWMDAWMYAWMDGWMEHVEPPGAKEYSHGENSNQLRWRRMRWGGMDPQT